MSSRDKEKRFAAVTAFPNVLEFPEDIKGKWNSDQFDDNQPITLELACGKGEYTVEMARRFPKQNFIGSDIKAERIYIGAKTAIAEKLNNVAFLRTKIEQLDLYFIENEVAEIWITFPDPYPKKKHAKRRLTSPYFLDMYKKILQPGGLVHLKTDADDLHNYSLETVTAAGANVKEAVMDIYNKPLTNPLLEIKTNFENKHLADNRTINYLCFQF
ncbi:MAG: tRNA (guanosine(46)-N7)-methyltransferase TrmB [bacterium]|nr:tRNA (guanosine(46)-N7)-methyltransferase TrmB [bacterium]